MTAGLLFIIAGLLFTFTGVGIIIGMPMIVIGFLMMLSNFLGRFSPLAALIIIGIALAFVSHAKAGERPSRNLIPAMLELHSCMQGHAGVRGDAVLNVVKRGDNPVVYLTDKCPNESVAFVEACERDGYAETNCYRAVVGDARDIVEDITQAAQLAP